MMVPSYLNMKMVVATVTKIIHGKQSSPLHVITLSLASRDHLIWVRLEIAPIFLSGQQNMPVPKWWSVLAKYRTAKGKRLTWAIWLFQITTTFTKPLDWLARNLSWTCVTHLFIGKVSKYIPLIIYKGQYEEMTRVNVIFYNSFCFLRNFIKGKCRKFEKTVFIQRKCIAKK